MIGSTEATQFSPRSRCPRVIGACIAALMLATATVPTLGAPILVINGDGAAEAPFAPGTASGDIQFEQTVGGLGAAQVSFDARNEKVEIQSSDPRPLLGDNTILSGEIYVTATEVTVDDATAAQGVDRMKIRFRNPDDGAQVEEWVGSFGGGSGMDWFPSEGNTWTAFNYDLTQLSWWANDYSGWEVYRVILFENDDEPYQNEFAVRNLQLVPEPASLALLGLGAMLIAGRRSR